jgi:Trk-type K+ transport system membrane component
VARVGWACFVTISAFSNVGFVPFSTNLIPFVNDPLICLVIAFLIVAGNVAFPLFYRFGVWCTYKLTSDLSWKYLLR